MVITYFQYRCHDSEAGKGIRHPAQGAHRFMQSAALDVDIQVH